MKYIEVMCLGADMRNLWYWRDWIRPHQENIGAMETVTPTRNILCICLKEQYPKTIPCRAHRFSRTREANSLPLDWCYVVETTVSLSWSLKLAPANNSTCDIDTHISVIHTSAILYILSFTITYKHHLRVYIYVYSIYDG